MVVVRVANLAGFFVARYAKKVAKKALNLVQMSQNSLVRYNFSKYLHFFSSFLVNLALKRAKSSDKTAKMVTLVVVVAVGSSRSKMAVQIGLLCPS